MGRLWFRLPCAAIVLGALTTGCAPPPWSQSRYWDPIDRPADAGDPGSDEPRSGDGGVDPDPDPDPEGEGEPPGGPATTVSPPPVSTGGVATSCSLRVTVTTVTTGRDYRPRNIGAVWVTDGANRFVKTLAVWANRRVASLAQWSTSTSAAGLSRNRTDAVSGATANNHNNPHSGTWNCTSARGERMPDGNYNICFEMTESNRGDGASRFNCVPVVKGPQAFDRTVPDDASFRARRLQFTP